MIWFRKAEDPAKTEGCELSGQFCDECSQVGCLV